MATAGRIVCVTITDIAENDIARYSTGKLFSKTFLKEYPKNIHNRPINRKA
jgi:hypothetical protein